MQNSAKNDKFPLFENIMLLGVSSEKLNEIQYLTAEEIGENITGIKAILIRNYQSNYLSDTLDDAYFSDILRLSFPEPIIDLNSENASSVKFHTFCMYRYNKIKHITCMYIPTGLRTKTNMFITIFTCLLIISPLDIYDCQRSVLLNFYRIINDYFLFVHEKNIKKVKNFRLREIFFGEESTEKIEEYRALGFYFSFLLDTLVADRNIPQSMCDKCLLI